MSLFGTFARRIDLLNASRAPLDTDGARPETHAAEKRLVWLGQLFKKPVLTPLDVVCHSPPNWLYDAFSSYQSSVFSEVWLVRGLMTEICS